MIKVIIIIIVNVDKIILYQIKGVKSYKITGKKKKKKGRIYHIRNLLTVIIFAITLYLFVNKLYKGDPYFIEYM